MSQDGWNRWKRYIALPTGYVCFVYCLLMLFLMSAEEWLLYPRGGSYGDDPSFPHEEVWLESSDGVRLHAWHCPATPDSHDRPVVLFCHGNGGELTQRKGIARRWQQGLGADVLLFDYRGFGLSEGVPNEEGLFRDAHAAYRWLREVKGYPANRILIVGRSLGGAVALELAAKISVPALVLESTFTSAAEVAGSIYPWLPVARLMRDPFHSIQRLDDYQGAVFFSHGDADELIPLEHMRRLYDRAPGPKEFRIFPGVGHNTAPPLDYYRDVKHFLQRHCPHLTAEEETN